MENTNEELVLVLADEGRSVHQKEVASKILKVVSLIVIYAFLAVFALIMIFPFYWMIITSLQG